MCLPTCPTYDATKRERNSPRGRISLMRAVADGELEISREFADEMSYCLGCLACQTACPPVSNYAELFETARSDIERAGVSTGLQRGNSGAPSRCGSSSSVLGRFARRHGLAAVSALGPGGAGAALRGDCVCCRRACGGSSRRRRVWRRRSRTRSSRARGAARVSREVSRGAADGLRAGSRLSGRESRYGRRAARQRLRRRDAAASSRAAARCTRTTATRTVRASLPGG